MKRRQTTGPLVVLFTVVLCLGVSACGSSKSTASGSSTGNSSSSSGSDNEKTSLNALLAGNKNSKCTFSETDPDTHLTSSGTMYIAGKRMRGDFTSQDQSGAPTSSSMLRDNTYEYTWQSDTKSGIKMKLSDIEATTTSTTIKGVTTTTVKDETTTTSPDAQDNTQYNYNCTKWTVDEAMLTPPSDVNFVDYAAQMQQMQSQMQSQMGANAAQACQQIPDADTRATCMSQLRQSGN